MLKLTKMGEGVGNYDRPTKRSEGLCETNGNENEWFATDSTCDKDDHILPTSSAPVISVAPHTPTPIKIRADISCNITGNAKFISPTMLSPVTKMSMSRAATSARRRASHSEIFTSSPYKNKLLAIQSKAKQPNKKAVMRRKWTDIGPTRKKIKLTERQSCKKSKNQKPNDSPISLTMARGIAQYTTRTGRRIWLDASIVEHGSAMLVQVVSRPTSNATCVKAVEHWPLNDDAVQHYLRWIVISVETH